jgi:hypothetical protein
MIGSRPQERGTRSQRYCLFYVSTSLYAIFCCIIILVTAIHMLAITQIKLGSLPLFDNYTSEVLLVVVPSPLEFVQLSSRRTRLVTQDSSIQTEEEEEEDDGDNEETTILNEQELRAAGLYNSNSTPYVVPNCTEYGRPPLNTLLGTDYTIKTDISWLLDFAIVGFGKCGTTTLTEWFNIHPSVQIFRSEVYDLQTHRPYKFAQRLYCELEAGDQYKRGYKSPTDIAMPHVLGYFTRYFPRAKLIVGLRHPVL